MTPARFSKCLDQIGWSQRRLAKELDVHEMKPRRWANGTTQVPSGIAEWLAKLALAVAAAHRKYPVPEHSEHHIITPPHYIAVKDDNDRQETWSVIEHATGHVMVPRIQKSEAQWAV